MRAGYPVPSRPTNPRTAKVAGGAAHELAGLYDRLVAHASAPGGIASRSLVVDTDGGTDDAVALWWALGEPGVEVVAVLASAGNVERDVAAANVGRILRAAGRTSVPVALGAGGTERAGGEAVRAVLARAVHGHDGLGGCADRWPPATVDPAPEPAAELLARLTCVRPGDLDIVTLGPLTTLAATLRIDPGLATRIRSLTVMGGVLTPDGHSVTTAESNVGHDPGAAAQVLATPWAGREPPMLVPLDVTRRTLLASDDLAVAEAGHTVAGRFVADPLRRYARSYSDMGQVPPGSAPCHDLLATMAAVHPEVITEAPSRRLTVGGAPAPPGVPWRVALEADSHAFRAAFRSLAAAGP
jgi:purine nucleosidase